MALIYQNQAKLEKLLAKANTNQSGLKRLSDIGDIVFGGRGADYDELVYLRGKNTDAETVNKKTSDAWVKFAPANSSGSASKRADQQKHDFLINGTYP